MRGLVEGLALAWRGREIVVVLRAELAIISAFWFWEKLFAGRISLEPLCCTAAQGVLLGEGWLRMLLPAALLRRSRALRSCTAGAGPWGRRLACDNWMLDTQPALWSCMR